MISLTLNGVAVDLGQDEKIVTVYQNAPISSIGTRSAAVSFGFNIPKTANNIAAIGNSDNVLTVTNFPYSIIEARLTVDGIDQNIRFASIEGIGGEIQVRLYGNNIDFFGRIKGKRLSDLDLSAYDHFHYIDEIDDFLDTTEGVAYPVLDFHSDSPNSFIDNSNRRVNVKYLLPSVYLSSIISQIATDAGFTLSGGVLTEANYLAVYLPCRSYEYHSTADFSFQFPSTFPFASTDTLVFRVKGENLTLKSRSRVTITRVLDGTKIVAETQADEVLTLAGINPTWVVVENTSGITYPPFTNFTGGSHTIEIDFVIENTTADNTLELFEVEYSVNGGAYQIFLIRGVGIGYNGFLDIAASLGDMKQDDLLKVVAQMFGLLINTNPQTKEVSFYRLSDITDKIGSGYDWSDKVDYQDAQIKFRSNYAQFNDAEYLEDETVTKKSGTDYFFQVNDLNLPYKKTVFKSPFSATNWRLRLVGFKVPQIKTFESAGTSDEEVFKPKPRILVKNSNAQNLTYTDGATNVVQNPFLSGYFLDDDSFNLGWQSLIENYSQELISLLDGFRVVNERIRLNAADINQLDLSNPVYLDRYGAWFLINSVKFDHSTGESAEVELIKLQ
jgi:hypothetical protein